MTPKLVIFDLGRILVRICDGWQHACGVAGVPVPSREVGADAQAALHDLVCRNEVDALDIDGFCREAASLLGLSNAHVRSVSDAYLLGLFPGVVELLDDLRAAGVRTACLSNTNANHWRLMLDPAGPLHAAMSRLDYQFASHLLRLRKPDDAIYAAVERAAEVPGGRIVFFDDLQENVDAAARRGWNAHRIAPCDDPVAHARRHLQAHGVLR